MGRIISWNGIFAINSFAHTFGKHVYNDDTTATNSALVAFFSNGEGYHSYHHEFPYDYRHGVKWNEWDPTKWLIWLWEQMGLAHGLVRAPSHLIAQSELETIVRRNERKLRNARDKFALHMSMQSPGQELPLPPAREGLPLISVGQLQKFHTEYAQKAGPVVLVRVGDLLCDVTAFQVRHPGGAALLKAMHLQDCTESFATGKNMHTRAARNIVERLAVASFREQPKQHP